MDKRNIVITLLVILIISLFAIIISFNLRQKDPLHILDDEIVYVESSKDFEPYTYPFQIDNSLKNEIVPLNSNWRSLNDIFTLVFNGYPDDEPYQRVTIFEVQYDDILKSNSKVIRRQGGRVNGLEYEEVIELVSENDISKDFENKNDYNIQIFQPLSSYNL
jgi:hypothetical protein